MNTLILKNDIKKIFIFSRGPIYFTGKDFRHIEVEENSSPSIPLDIFFSSLQNTIDLLSKKDKKIYYVTENPEIGSSPRLCAPRPLRIRHKECKLEKRAVVERQSLYLKKISDLKNVVVIQTLNSFCPDNTCLIILNGKLLYADDDHLSITGSQFQADKILYSHLTD